MSERCEARIRRSDCEIFEFFFRVQAIVPSDRPRRKMGDAAGNENSDRLAFERLDGSIFRPCYQREHRSGHEAGYHLDRYAAERAADRRAADSGGIIHIAIGQCRTACSRRNANDFSFKPFLFKKTSFLRQRESHELAGKSGHANSDLIQRIDWTVEDKQ